MTYLGIDYGVRTAYLAHVGRSMAKPNLPKLFNTQKLEYDEIFPDTFIKLFETALVGVDEVYIEQVQHLSVALEMAIMAGRMQILCQRKGLKVTFVHPATWRKAVLGNGRAKKPEAVKFAYYKYGYVPTSLKVRSYEPDHNSCEAICIAHYAGMTREGKTWDLSSSASPSSA